MDGDTLRVIVEGLIVGLMTAGPAYLRRVIRDELAPLVDRVADLERESGKNTTTAKSKRPDITKPIHLDVIAD